MILLEGGNYDGIVLFIMFIMFGPPVILTIIGFSIRKTYPQTAKFLYILAVVYAIAGLGICGNML